jgi:hypothetical protein
VVETGFVDVVVAGMMLVVVVESAKATAPLAKVALTRLARTTLLATNLTFDENQRSIFSSSDEHGTPARVELP